MTRDGGRGPMRTEEDLRQALATLERHAPNPDTVMAVVRDVAGGDASPASSSSSPARPALAGSAGGRHRHHMGGGAGLGWSCLWPLRRRPSDW